MDDASNTAASSSPTAGRLDSTDDVALVESNSNCHDCHASEDGQAVPLEVRRRDSRPSFEPGLTGGETCDSVVDDDDDPLASSAAHPHPPHKPEKWWSTLAAGGIAGALSRTCVAPLERLKILFQVQGLSARGAPLRHTGVLRSLRDLVAKDGFTGLWRGNGLNCVRVVPSSAIQFFSYTEYKRFLYPGVRESDLRAWQHACAGGLAGATSTLMTYPLDLLRARRTVDFRGDVPESLYQAFASIVRTEGARGLFRGIGPSLCGIVPYIGIDFALFEVGKAYCRKHDLGLNAVTGELTSLTKVGCGFLAGICGMTVAFPFDTLRRNLQVATLKLRGDVASTRPKTVGGVLKAIVKEGGPAALYRGIFANYLKAGPSVGISFATFEAAKQFFDAR
ncbi:mitochondrial carrier domain-containing protein [Pelagophyceae sp. CCMP2097]|nr:mitochondrial carrier domain-containing protein [Pelagophyceae sp. CCMP2097]|mmetsp:Transcript_6252/g.22171  ORF Transcript_6252/g.22171 Transcript_6252/m.22171 type:complete len:393 (+) Transcript_6252:77-1255(+)